ncbi:DEKNAAC105510 [Brettanomyces naardenensis]|uniref:DEKNAAC105510 n=1 Tax=Brettanomyces naardenensis TaxID=13370 RepID=A0A448YU32_BRENA|nr:DEKNAAC105510 [Brettanomyces naardenensis]
MDKQGDSHRGRHRSSRGGRNRHREVVGELGDDEAKRERRRARFAREDSQIQRDKSKEFGLISRGEDLRLQNDARARRSLYRETIEKVKLFQSVPGTKGITKDGIAMDFRKLRESILKMPPDDFSRKVLLSSVRFSVSVGHYQSYVPAIRKLLDIQEVLEKNELEEIWSYLVLHVFHFGREYERGFKMYFEHVSEIERQMVGVGKESSIKDFTNAQILYRLLRSYIKEDYYDWLVVYKYLSLEADPQRSNYFAILKATAYMGVMQAVVDRLEGAFFVLQKSIVEKLAHMEYKTLVKTFSLKWSLNESTNIVTLRERMVQKSVKTCSAAVK